LRYSSSARFIVNKTRSSHDPNIVNMKHAHASAALVPLTLKFK